MARPSPLVPMGVTMLYWFLLHEAGFPRANKYTLGSNRFDFFIHPFCYTLNIHYIKKRKTRSLPAPASLRLGNTGGATAFASPSSLPPRASAPLSERAAGGRTYSHENAGGGAFLHPFSPSLLPVAALPSGDGGCSGSRLADPQP